MHIIFLISAQKHRLWVLVRTASPRGGSNEYPQSMFRAEIWKIPEFLTEHFHFFGGKIFSIFEQACFRNATRIRSLIWVFVAHIISKGMCNVHPDETFYKELSHQNLLYICHSVLVFWLTILFINTMDVSKFKNRKVHFRNIWNVKVKKKTKVTKRMNSTDLYHSLGKFNRRQIYHIFLTFSRKKSFHFFALNVKNRLWYLKESICIKSQTFFLRKIRNIWTLTSENYTQQSKR